MNRLSFVIGFLLVASFFSCKKASTNIINEPYPEDFVKAINAHGGLGQWKSMHTLRYTMIKSDSTKEMHQIDLHSRKVRLDHADYSIGYDGNDVWVAPNKAAFGKGSARFYHNLYFYFLAMPYVAADPGVNYEVLPERDINGRSHDVIRISYGAEVGDAPDDEYILHFDQETGLLHLLLYTVTYYTKEKSKKYNALVFDDWIDVEGLKLPKSFKGYKYENDQLGDLRYERVFMDHYLSDQPLVESTFSRPAISEIDSLQ